MRINYSDDEAYDGQFELWQANCDRSINGKKGQAELMVLSDALMALSEKRLIRGLLYDDNDGVCAIGAYVKYKGVDLRAMDPEEDSDEAGVEAGMPSLVAWKVVEMNDLMFYRHTPEARYTAILTWVNARIKPEGT